VIAERSQADKHSGPRDVQTEQSDESAAEGEGGPHEDGAAAAHDDEPHPGAAHTDESEKVLGVDIESTPLIVLAVIAALGLATLAATPIGRTPAVLLAIALIAVAWAALDIREAVHQLNESRTNIFIVAIILAGVHLTAAALAGRLAHRADLTTPDHPGTMPA
jgi:hypothetical protein